MAQGPLAVGYLPTRYPVLSETFVRLEVEELRRQGVEVVVAPLLPGDVPTREPLLLLYAEDRPHRVVALAHLRWLLRSPRRYARFWRVARAAGEERGEVVARHLPWLAEQLRARGVTVLHAHFAWSSAARAHALSALTGWPWSVTVHAHDVFGGPVRLAEKLAAADAVVTVCDYNARHLRDAWGVHDVDLVVCGVEVPPEAPAPPPEVDVLAVGRLVEKKGFDLLVRAAARLPAGTRVRVVGEGPERARLEALVAETGAPVELVGAQPHEQVLAAVPSARVLCLPARIAADGDRDSMPLVVKEAMARGVPVVVSDTAGLPEAVDDEVGWVVPSEDVDALVAALRAALDDPEEARRRGRAGRARVRARFTLAGEVAKQRAVLTRLAGR